VTPPATMLEQTPPPGRTVHLPTQPVVPQAPVTAVPTARKSLRLSDLKDGETGRVIRVMIPEAGCRKRFAELGLAPGMKVTVAGTGETLMLMIGGSRMGLAARCAEEITVVRV
jgi:Fe2+ transport system protein FeoA